MQQCCRNAPPELSLYFRWIPSNASVLVSLLWGGGFTEIQEECTSEFSGMSLVMTYWSEVCVICDFFPVFHPFPKGCPQGCPQEMPTKDPTKLPTKVSMERKCPWKCVSLKWSDFTCSVFTCCSLAMECLSRSTCRFTDGRPTAAMLYTDVRMHCAHELGESNRPLTSILLKRIAIRLPSLLRYFCRSMPPSGQRVVYMPPMCITIRLPFVSRCFCRSIRVRGLTESGQGGWKLRGGETYRKTPPQKRLWTPPHLRYGSPAPFWRLSVISLKGRGTDQTNPNFWGLQKWFWRARSAVRFPLPPNSTWYVLPRPPLRKIPVPIKIKSALPPHPQTQNTPSPKTRNFYGHGGFSCRKKAEILGAHKLGAAPWEPETH